ncbi:MAG: ABC transporter ATP-binding protein [Bacteroidetes bacterium]|nr:MAG: ABC transporter ATP-binding protein [Bacteroidota bacterium]
MSKFSRLFGYLRPYRSQMLVYFGAILLSTVFSITSIGMLMPFFKLIFLGEKLADEKSSSPLMQWINERMAHVVSTTGGNMMQLLFYICGFMLLSIVLKNLFLYLAYYILNPLKNKVVTQLRADMYSKVLQLPIGYFTEQRKGDLMSRITNDIAEVEQSVVGTLEGWIRDPMQIIINLAVLFFISFKLTLFLLIMLPVMGLIIGRISRSLKKQSLEAAELQGQGVSVLDETLGGLRVIKAFTAEAALRSRFFGINNQLLHTKNAMGYRRDLASPLSETLGILVFCAVLLVGGALVINDKTLDGAALIGYLGLFYNIINPAKALSTSFYNMQKGSAAIVRIEEVLNTSNLIEDKPEARPMAAFAHSISFKQVGFAYNDVEILQGINLTVPKGKTVALVGSSGAGKSTLADLVPRFHDVSQGQVLIDGVNIKDYQLETVRQQMGIVTQEPILFNDTIRNNIALGMPHATDEQVEAAARVANAHHFIVKKEQGYHTNIGDRGSKLSGGERQRLTIARAVLKNPPILILDEATSSLDTESEQLVQEAINNVMHNRTTLVIAHRLSTIRHADDIVVLQKGQIVEQGNHEQLMAVQGVYAKLVQIQGIK